MITLKKLLATGDDFEYENESIKRFFKTLKSTKMRLDPIVKASWLYALRAGFYKQGKEALKSEKNFCCLGVLGDLIEGVEWETGPAALTNCKFNGQSNCSILPTKLQTKLHLTKKIQNALADANDQGNLNFKQIADVIERFL